MLKDSLIQYLGGPSLHLRYKFCIFPLLLLYLLLLWRVSIFLSTTGNFSHWRLREREPTSLRRTYSFRYLGGSSLRLAQLYKWGVAQWDLQEDLKNLLTWHHVLFGSGPMWFYSSSTCTHIYVTNFGESNVKQAYEGRIVSVSACSKLFHTLVILASLFMCYPLLRATILRIHLQTFFCIRFQTNSLLWKHTCVFCTFFTLTFLRNFVYLIICNEYKVWYWPYFEGVYHTRMIETFSNANARMGHTIVWTISA